MEMIIGNNIGDNMPDTKWTQVLPDPSIETKWTQEPLPETKWTQEQLPKTEWTEAPLPKTEWKPVLPEDGKVG